MSQSTSEPLPPREHTKRRQKFIRKDLQLKIIFASLFVALFVLVFSLQVPFIGLWLVQKMSPQSVESIFTLFNKLLLTSLCISMLLTIPLSLWMGVVFSFHFCGPIHRIKMYFDYLLSGRWDKPLSLRETDDLQDVKDSINAFMDRSNNQLRDQHGLLDETRALLLGSLGRQLDPVKVEDLLQKLSAESNRFEARLGEPKGPSKPDAAERAPALQPELDAQPA